MLRRASFLRNVRFCSGLSSNAATDNNNSLMERYFLDRKRIHTFKDLYVPIGIDILLAPDTSLAGGRMRSGQAWMTRLQR